MVGQREIPRTATFTWSPEVSSQILATGTKAGAVDEGFSNDTRLELWNLELNDPSKSNDVELLGSVSTDSRFNDIAWTKDQATNSKSVIAGALDNGSLDLWNAEKLAASETDSFLSRTSKHSGSIKALQFNAFRSELLATVGAKGELFISDINSIGSPFRMGNAVARADDFECLDWNKRTSHIMVTGSNGGIITVWDVKNKRESLTLNNLGRKPVSAVAWDPVKTTRLVTAVPNDSDPVILVWDLRNANAPERVLKGHDGGVLSLSWCQLDGDLLLSCGKDNRNICWNPQTGHPYGELPVVTNWTFETRWNPKNPNFVATASFDGRITVNPIQNTNTQSQIQAATQNQSVDDEDFFNKAQSQPQGTKFSLSVPPKWLQRPCGATFAFGGKMVTFKSSKSEAQKRSVVRVSNYAIDDSIVSAAESFEASLKQGNLDIICETRIANASEETDKNDWRIIRLLASENNRKGLIDHLGLHDIQEPDPNGSIDNHGDEEASQDTEKRPTMDQTGSRNNRLSAFFDNGTDSDNFLSELAATKGAKINNPFQVYTGSESDLDREITHSLLLGNFDEALNLCISEQRISDAFMIAICGGQKCIEKAQQAYFKQRDSAPNYLRLLASIVGKNLWDLVHNAELDNWREVMATICTYAEAGEFQDLCEALGDRLEEQMTFNGAGPELRKDAAFCFLAGSKLEKVVALWLSELKQIEESGSSQLSAKSSGFFLHARLLQSFVEKVTVFREVTRYTDKQLEATSDWKLAPLYDRYIEYADIASAHGQLQVAERYLELLPSQYAAAGVAKGRIKKAMGKFTPQPASQQETARGPQKAARGVLSFQQAQQVSTPSLPAAPTNYSSSSASQNPYAPSNTQYGRSTYTGGYQAQQQPPPQPPMAYGVQYQNGLPGAPPLGTNASPSMPPPSKNMNVGNWNDMPESFFKPPTASRRGTPNANANGHYNNQPAVLPTNHPIAPPARSTPPLGPPPKAGAGAPRVMSPPVKPQEPSQQIERPSSAANPYAPASANLPVQSQLTIPRGPSPYNAPPSAAPPSNRYAPSQPAASPRAESPMMPTSGRQVGPPTNPYAPKQSAISASRGPPSQQQGAPPPAPPQKSNPPPATPLQTPPSTHSSSSPQTNNRSTASKYRKCVPIMSRKEAF